MQRYPPKCIHSSCPKVFKLAHLFIATMSQLHMFRVMGAGYGEILVHQSQSAQLATGLSGDPEADPTCTSTWRKSSPEICRRTWEAAGRQGSSWFELYIAIQAHEFLVKGQVFCRDACTTIACLLTAFWAPLVPCQERLDNQCLAHLETLDGLRWEDTSTAKVVMLRATASVLTRALCKHRHCHSTKQLHCSLSLLRRNFGHAVSALGGPGPGLHKAWSNRLYLPPAVTGSPEIDVAGRRLLKQFEAHLEESIWKLSRWFQISFSFPQRCVQGAIPCTVQAPLVPEYFSC